MRALAGAALATLTLVFGTGCGTGGPAEGGDANQGRKVFQTVGQCGSCHTMRDAGAGGKVGPNLDEAFEQSRAEGYKESAIKNVVLDQIRFPTRDADGDAPRPRPAGWRAADSGVAGGARVPQAGPGI